MFTSHARTFAAMSAAVLVLGLSQNLRAQNAVARDAVILQANATLADGIRSGNVSERSTRAALVARHEHLIAVFRNHPETARSYMLDPATRAALLQAQPSYAALIEQDRPLTGELISAVADDFVHHISTEQYSLHGRTGDRALSFTMVRDDLHRLLHHNVTVTGLSLPEIVAAENLREARPSELETAASTAVTATASAVAAATFTGPGVPPGSATALEIPLGPQTTAVLILKFASGTVAYPTGFDQQSFYNQVFNGPVVPNIASFMNEVSYGQTSVSADVYGPITVPGNFDCNSTDAMANAAIAAATGTVDFTKYNHYVFVYPVHGCYFGGLGSTGPGAPTAAIPHQNTYIWAPIEDSYTVAGSSNFFWLAINHEFGHNLGLNHGNSIDFGALPLGPLDFTAVTPGLVTPGGHAPENSEATAAAVNYSSLSARALTAPTGSTAITAVNTEYGDKFANMGDGQAPFSGQHHVQELGWIPASGNQDVTTSGAFTIFPTETNSGLRTLHVLRDPVSSSWIWVEFHQSLGIYTPLSLTVAPYNVPNNVLSGAQLHYQNGFGDQLHTLLMDMTATATPNNFFNSNLVPGASWSDPFSLLTITTGTQTSNSLGVSVSYDTPCATVALGAPSIAAAGGAGSVTLTAPATCSWSVSSNASWISFTSATTGSGNGTVTFNATANATTNQRNSYITAQRQSLSLVQEGTALSVVSLSPPGNTVAPGVSIPLVLNLKDALGVADLSQINFTIVGGTSPDCKIAAVANSNNAIDLYLSTNGTNSGPVTTGTAGTLSNSSCTINTVNSSYAASGQTITFTLAVSFPATFTGIHNITVSADGASLSSNAIPVGFVNVTTGVSNAASVVMTPASLSAPLMGAAGTTMPFTIAGLNTAFTPASTVQVSGTGVSVSGLKVVNAQTLTGSLTVGASASPGLRTVTINSSPGVITTSFTVLPHAATTTLTLSPSSGLKGTTVPVKITGAPQSVFSPNTTVAISGTGVTVTNVAVYVTVAGYQITANFVIADDAGANTRTVTVTSGSQVYTATFTVTPEVLPTVQAMPASANLSDTTFVTFTGTDTNFTTATKVAVSGGDITLKDPMVLDPSDLTVRFIVPADATPGPHLVTITTGTQVVTTTFLITAFIPTVTTIQASPTTLTTSQTTTLTVKVAPSTGARTPDGYVSFIEHKGGAGLDDILGTVALSGGHASLTLTNLAAGVHNFAAQYLGDNTTFAHSNSTVDAKVTVQ